MAAEQLEMIGNSKNFWLYSKAEGYDLTHPPAPDATPIRPRLALQTATSQVTIDPKKTALVIIDLQNYFLSPALGRPPDSPGLKSVDALLQNAIPACRKSGIPILWLQWGLTQADLDDMPPAILKGFSADGNLCKERGVAGLGSEIGKVQLPDGGVVDGGRVLMRDQWNSQTYGPLAEAAEEGDMWVHKNRLTGFWEGTETEEVLRANGIRTLLFAGCNTDQCVGGSLQDAFTKGWDCLLLSDCCSTMSPGFAQRCIEFNTEIGWGFVLSSRQLKEGVGGMQTS